MNEFTPSNHEQRTHRPESYRALGRAAAGDVGAFPAIRLDASTQPQEIQEDRPGRVYDTGTATTNVDPEYLQGNHPAQLRQQEKQRRADEDTGPQMIGNGPQTPRHNPDDFRNPDGSFNREAYIAYRRDNDQ